MIDIDKDYLITVNLKNTKIKSDKTLFFYNTDLNILIKVYKKIWGHFCPHKLKFINYFYTLALSSSNVIKSPLSSVPTSKVTE